MPRILRIFPWDTLKVCENTISVPDNTVQCGDLDLEKKIEEKIDQFIDRVEKHPNKKYQAEEIAKQSASRDCGFNVEGRETVSWIVDSGSSRLGFNRLVFLDRVGENWAWLGYGIDDGGEVDGGGGGGGDGVRL
ncbi:hypothetical protein RHGRI_023459 [Rhododendron griersonianum]|uniref:Uncharacterized protein n=1 Tax=Rhododendron griersonianum TaxID=479676 RepID=A0AAV6J930_9ERIC|nr:hypothetical protein RHGRI_023459 [Rhododendron griersonianum]